MLLFIGENHTRISYLSVISKIFFVIFQKCEVVRLISTKQFRYVKIEKYLMGEFPIINIISHHSHYRNNSDGYHFRFSSRFYL